MSSVSKETPRHSVSSFDQVVTQWMSTTTVVCGSAWNSAHVHFASSDPPSCSASVHAARSTCGVGPADRTGKSLTRCWPGGTRALRPSGRRPRNPRETGDRRSCRRLVCQIRAAARRGPGLGYTLPPMRDTTHLAWRAALAIGLRGSNSAVLAFARCWNDSVSLVLAIGFAPPLAVGFETFKTTSRSPRPGRGPEAPGAPREAAALRHAPAARRSPRGISAPAARACPASWARRPCRCLHDLPALETALAKTLVKGAAEGPAKGPVAWEEVGDTVWLPLWQAQAPKAGRRPGRDRRPRRSRTPRGSGSAAASWAVGARDAREAADFAVGIGLAVLLGSCRPARREPPRPTPRDGRRRGERFEIFDVRTRLAEGQEAVGLAASVRQSGIADADLGAACASEPAVAERLALTR